MTVIIYTGLCVLFFNLYMMGRVHKVGQERQRVLDLLNAKGTKELYDLFMSGELRDIDYKVYSKNLYAEYDKYTFDQMLWQFWKPVRSFYDGIYTSV